MSSSLPPVNMDLHDDEGEGRKRLFLGLTLATGGLICLGMLLLTLIPIVGLETIHPWAPVLFGLLMVVPLLLVAWATVGLVLNVAFGRSLPFFSRMRGISVRLLLPLMTLVGRAAGIPKQRIRASFVKVNNELVAGSVGTFSPAELLLLMPHCLQRSTCAMRLTYDINNCKRCGLCPIDGLLDLAARYGVSLAIATGGTIARRIVVQKRPRLILAVACERDLAAGIQDTYPLPVFGVMNERPHGPCLDTQVTLPHLEAALRRFLHADSLAAIDAAPPPVRLRRQPVEKPA